MKIKLSSCILSLALFAISSCTSTSEQGPKPSALLKTIQKQQFNRISERALQSEDLSVMRGKHGGGFLHSLVENATSWNEDHDRVLKLLLKEGVKLETQNELQETPLFVAIRKNNLKAFNALLQAGANLQFKQSFGENAMHYSALHGSMIILRDCESKGFSLVRDQDLKARNALFFAAIGGKLDVAKAYFQARGKVDPIEKGVRVTPLYYAVMSKNLEMVDLLLSHGANANLKAKDRSTALHAAVKNRDQNIVRYLVLNGGNPYIKNRRGKSAMDLAQDLNLKRIEEILKRYR